MSHINTVIIGGNLTRDPEVRYTPAGKAVCNASIASTEKWKTESGEAKERTTFLDLTIWGQRGEAFGKYNKKGNQVLVEGSLSQETWVDKKTNENRSKIVLQVDQWHFAGERRNSSATPNSSPAKPAAASATASPSPRTEDDDVPF